MGLFDRFLRTKQELKTTSDMEERVLCLISEGNVSEEQGNAAAAMQNYEAAIRIMPTSARAHLNRGNILLERGDAVEALAAYATAISIDPNYPAAHFNSGNAYVELKSNEAAKSAYEKAIELKPDFADAHVALGCVLEDMGHLDMAAESYRCALSFNPNYAEVYGNLGNTLRSLDRIDEAITSYQSALERSPNLINIRINLGSALRAAKRHKEAQECFKQILNNDPRNTIAYFELGLTLQEVGHLDEAMEKYRSAIRYTPSHVESHIRLGDICRELRKFDEALTHYRMALEFSPNHAIAHNNLANIYLDTGNYDAAITGYRKALELQPDFAAAHSNLGSALKDIGLIAEALTHIHRALELMPDMAQIRSNLIFIKNCYLAADLSETRAEAVRFGKLVKNQARIYTSWDSSPLPDRRLRIGFISGDFRDHPVGHFIKGVLHALSSNAKDSLELHAYSTHFSTDMITEQIQNACDYWHASAALSDSLLAEKIHHDAIDILIDLSGHTAHNRLAALAWKPAPVQATWLGYLGTTGVEAIDYLIADAWTLPAADEINFTEKIWRLPETYISFTPPPVDTPVSPLPAERNGHITFGCFNNLTKINDPVIALWARVLASIPKSRLCLKAKQFAEPAVCKSIADRFASHGIDADRLILAPQVPRSEYLVPYQQIDIGLDPFPYTGITTSVESLWMGVPVLTLAGENFLSRQGIGLLNNVGLPDWIAADQDDYVAKAIRHAGDTQALSRLRGELRTRMSASPILDNHRFAFHFHAALRKMWQQWCDSDISQNSIRKNEMALSQPKSGLSQDQILPLPPMQSSLMIHEIDNKLKLHIGGKQIKPGWKILNAMKFEGVDYLGDVRNLNIFPDNCCEAVYASHVMEHVPQKDFLKTLQGIHRILAPNGRFYFSAPDLETLCRLMLDRKLGCPQHFHVMRMIFGGQVDEFDFHFIGLTEEFMHDYLHQAGFTGIERVNSFGLFDDTSDFCPYGVPISLNLIVTK